MYLILARKIKEMAMQSLIQTQNRLSYGIKEAAESLGVSVSFLRLEITRKHLRPTRLGRRLVITAEELRRYLSQ